jgi:hypothetical protein
LRAFLFTNGIMLDLTMLISPASEVMLEDAQGINDAGQIVANGFHPWSISAACVQAGSRLHF